MLKNSSRGFEKMKEVVTDTDPYVNQTQEWVKVLCWQAACTVETKTGTVVGDSSLTNSILWIPPFGKLLGHKSAIVEVE